MRHTNSGFTLIELFAVIAIVAILAVIVIPSLLNTKYMANESAAVAHLKSFSTAMIGYYEDQLDACYPTSTSEFGFYFTHVPLKAGYNYYYATNVSKTSKASAIVYYAYPTSTITGKRIFMVDETCRVWEAKINKTSQLKDPTVDFTKDGSARIIDPSDLVWTQKT